MIQLFVAQPKQHGSAGTSRRAVTPSVDGPLAGFGKKLLESYFDVNPTGTFEEDGVSWLGQGTHQAPGGGGLVEKKRGVGPKAGTLGCIQHVAGRAAYPNEHINTALRDIVADVAVKRLSPVAEFEHLPQNCDTLPRGRVF